MRGRGKLIKVCPWFRLGRFSVSFSSVDPDYISFLESLAAPVPKPEVTTGKSP